MLHAALERLRAAAAETIGSFPSTTWRRVEGPGPDTVELVAGTFQGLVLEPNQRLVLEADLDLPAELAGVPTTGEDVLVTIDSLYRVSLEWDGQCLIDETLGQEVLAAPSPALRHALTSTGRRPGGRLRLTVEPPDNQLMPWWVHLYFTTPGLRRRFELLDTAWARLALAAEVAVGADEEAAVAKAASLVPELLVTSDEQSLTNSLDQMADALSPLAPKAEALDVHIVAHCHIDLSWLWTWPDAKETVKRDFRSVVSLLDDYPELTFTHSQPATYAVIRDEEPALFERVRQFVAEGRWEAATMTWVEGDNNLVTGESLAHQLQEGVGFTVAELGVRPRVYMAPDNFGHAGNLPQLARSAGADVYYHMRANPGQADMWPAYWWEGDDGSRILAVSTPRYGGEITAGEVAAAAIRSLRHGQRVALHFHGVGDHGGGPARQSLDALRRLQQQSGLPHARCSTLGDYADAVVASGAPLPTRTGESSAIFEGCYTTHGDSKRMNREGENRLLTAEALSACAGLAPDLSPAWRTVAFNQFHDILDGSSIAEVYAQQADDFAGVAAAADDAVAAALAVLHAGLPQGAVAVTNPTGIDRLDAVVVPGLHPDAPVWLTCDATGHATAGQPTADGLCFVASVPAFATVAYRVAHDDGDLPAPLAAVPCFNPIGGAQKAVLDAPDVLDPPYLRIDTPAFQAYVRRDSGIIVSLKDRRVGSTGRQLVGWGLRRASDYLDAARPDLGINVLQVVEEQPHGMSAWLLAEVWRETTLLGTATTTVVEEGPVRVVLEVRHRFNASTITQRLAFYRDLARIDVATDVDWQEAGGPDRGVWSLKAGATVRTEGCEAWCETPFSAARRPADGQEVAAVRWADVGDDTYGLAIVNDAKHGYDALGNRLRLTLVRAAYSPDAVADVGTHHIDYSLVPHPGSWREAGVVDTAVGRNQPLLARVIAGTTAALAGTRHTPRVDAATVRVSSLAPVEGGVRLRLYETAGRADTAVLSGVAPSARLVELDMAGRPVAEVGRHLAFRPHEVRTVLIADADDA
jgi:alpha-mannosidase